MKRTRASSAFREFYGFSEAVPIPNLGRILNAGEIEGLIIEYTKKLFDKTIPLNLLIHLKEEVILEYGKEIGALGSAFLPLMYAALEKLEVAEEKLKNKSANSRHRKRAFETKQERVEEKLAREERHFRLLDEKFNLLKRVHDHMVSMERGMEADYKYRFNRALKAREEDRWLVVGWLYDNVAGVDIKVAPPKATTRELSTLRTMHQRDRELTRLIGNS